MRYTDYSSALKQKFGGRVQKISINAGFTCPNRDGTKGTGGCTYCNNQTFSPDYCHTLPSVSEQVEAGILFFHRKYETQRYLAYFQNYTNTYADLSTLQRLYAEAITHRQVAGLVIGTRPDCVSEALLDYLAELAETHYIMVEYGIESTLDQTLAFINRGHTYAEAEQAVRATAARGIETGAHLILGLPAESRAEIIAHADRISELPLTAVKFHQLQILRDTRMAEQYAAQPELFRLYTADEYVDLAIDLLEHLNPRIAVERFVSQSPQELLIAPDWGLKNFEFTAKINKRLVERESWQGKMCKIKSH